MARAAGVAIVFADSADYPCIADLSGDFSYARLQRCSEDEPAGYAPADLDRWAKTARAWAAGKSPPGLPYAAEPPPPAPRDTIIFFISARRCGARSPRDADRAAVTRSTRPCRRRFSSACRARPRASGGQSRAGLSISVARRRRRPPGRGADRRLEQYPRCAASPSCARRSPPVPPPPGLALDAEA